VDAKSGLLLVFENKECLENTWILRWINWELEKFCNLCYSIWSKEFEKSGKEFFSEVHIFAKYVVWEFALLYGLNYIYCR